MHKSIKIKFYRMFPELDQASVKDLQKLYNQGERNYFSSKTFIEFLSSGEMATIYSKKKENIRKWWLTLPKDEINFFKAFNMYHSRWWMREAIASKIGIRNAELIAVTYDPKAKIIKNKDGSYLINANISKQMMVNTDLTIKQYIKLLQNKALQQLFFSYNQVSEKNKHKKELLKNKIIEFINSYEKGRLARISIEQIIFDLGIIYENKPDNILVVMN